MAASAFVQQQWCYRVIVRLLHLAPTAGAPGNTFVLRVLAKPTIAGTIAPFGDVLMDVRTVERCADRVAIGRNHWREARKRFLNGPLPSFPPMEAFPRIARRSTRQSLEQRRASSPNLMAVQQLR